MEMVFSPTMTTDIDTLRNELAAVRQALETLRQDMVGIIRVEVRPFEGENVIIKRRIVEEVWEFDPEHADNPAVRKLGILSIDRQKLENETTNTTCWGCWALQPLQPQPSGEKKVDGPSRA